MRERLTARVLLFDPRGRILLMKGRLASDPDRPGEWFTIGGGVKGGETLEEAAAREIREESGVRDFVLGPVVARRDIVFVGAGGAPVLSREHYLVARCQGGDPSREGWNAAERALVDEIRWWSLESLAAMSEPVHPAGLAGRLADLVAGRYPAVPESWA